MIYVTKDQVQQVKYLINQSKQGNHLLFETESLRKVFWNKGPAGGLMPDKDAAPRISKHLEAILALPSLAQKRAYLERLDTETYEHVVRIYFHLVENELLETHTTRH